MNREIIQQKNLLDNLDLIANASKGSGLNLEKLSKIHEKICELADFLGISLNQAVILSIIADLSFNRSATIESMAKYLKCSVLKIIRQLDDLRDLEEKRYIVKTSRGRKGKESYGDLSFTVPTNVIDAIRTGDISHLNKPHKFDLPKFLKHMNDLLDERSECIFTTRELLDEVEACINANIDLPYVFFIDSTLSFTESKLIAFITSYYRLRGQPFCGVVSLCNELFDDFGDYLNFEQGISEGTHELIKRGILKVTSGNFDGDTAFMLTEKTLKKLYKDYPSLINSGMDEAGVVSCRSIMMKELFFNRELSALLGEIEAILMPSAFAKYCHALEKGNFLPGVAIMFYGEPGTGKTEAVYQIARKTRRDIMVVDLSKTRSKWFGDTEKIVKKIFTDYETLRKSKSPEPILFINEADGFMGRRMVSGNDVSPVDQTLNTVQNIILQSLENFRGILITTTNLTCNLDRAYERRFSFRVRFDRPDAECRKKIWMSKLPELTEEEAERLAEKYEMTGGEIDIYVRKVIMKKVLKQNKTLVELLEASLLEDKGFAGKVKVGFR